MDRAKRLPACRPEIDLGEPIRPGHSSVRGFVYCSRVQRSGNIRVGIPAQEPMRQHTFTTLLTLLAVTSLVSACSSKTPTQPTSKSDTTTVTVTPKVTLSLATSSPAAGSDVVVYPSAPTEGLVTVAFSATSDLSVVDAFLELHLLDAQGQPCGAGTSVKRSIAENGSSTFSIAGVTLTCAVPFAIETLKATLVTMTAANGQETRTELAYASVPAHYAFKAAAPTPGPPTPVSSGISLVSSDPAPGGETALTSSGAGFTYPKLEMTFSVLFDTALPDAKLQVELFDAGGANCWYTFVDHPIPAGISERVSERIVWTQGYPLAGTCGTYPQKIASVRATLLTLRGPEVNGRLQRTDYVKQTFPVSYTIQRYPPPPSNPPSAPLTISDFYWRNESSLPTCCDPPFPDDWITAACTVREADGAPVTVSITLTWDGFAPKTSTSTFPAGASSSAEGARVGLGLGAPMVAKPHATLVCVGSNARGDTVRKSTDIGTPPK